MLFTVQLFPLLLFHMSTIFVRILRTYRNKTKTRIFIDIYIYLYININNHDNIKLAWFAWCTISNWYTRTRRFVWLWATFSTLHFVLELRESEIRYRKNSGHRFMQRPSRKVNWWRCSPASQWRIRIGENEKWNGKRCTSFATSSTSVDDISLGCIRIPVSISHGKEDVRDRMSYSRGKTIDQNFKKIFEFHFFLFFFSSINIIPFY